jgi:NDP-sugar pyrophosphorylase family protein
MIPIGGKPILERTIEHLRRHSITDIVINLHFLPQMIIEHFGDGSRWGVRLTYSLEREALGTAGGVKNVARFFDDGPFVVWYGDNLSRCNLGRFIAHHEAKGSVATIALHYREDVSQSGIVGLDETDRIVRFVEKPTPEQAFSHWVNAGIYVLDPAVLSFIPAKGVLDFGRDIFPHMLAAGRPLYGYRLTAAEGLWWIDRPEDLTRVQQEWKEAI